METDISLFDVFEQIQPSPKIFKWNFSSGSLFFSVDDYIYAGTLYTQDGKTKIMSKKFYVLTINRLLESNDSGLRNPINYVASIELRNPRINYTRETN